MDRYIERYDILSCRIGVKNIAFSLYRIASVTNEMSATFR